MSPVSLTAFIITFHNLAALFMLIFALLFSLLGYAIFLRKLKHKKSALAILFVLFLLLGFALSKRLFQQKPLNFEVVQVG
jgi:Kef-type K+ transport system membrane component KefB